MRILAVVKRRLIGLLGLDVENGVVVGTQGIFDLVAGENTIIEICSELERESMIVDTSYFSGAIEIMIGTIIVSEMFDKYRYYKRVGKLDDKPVISIVLEEALRVQVKGVRAMEAMCLRVWRERGESLRLG